MRKLALNRQHKLLDVRWQSEERQLCVVVVVFKVLRQMFVPSNNMEEAGISGLYCSQPQGGDRNILVPLTGSSCVIHLYIQPMCVWILGPWSELQQSAISPCMILLSADYSGQINLIFSVRTSFSSACWKLIISTSSSPCALTQPPTPSHQSSVCCIYPNRLQ